MLRKDLTLPDVLQAEKLIQAMGGDSAKALDIIVLLDAEKLSYKRVARMPITEVLPRCQHLIAELLQLVQNLGQKKTTPSSPSQPTTIAHPVKSEECP